MADEEHSQTGRVENLSSLVVSEAVIEVHNGESEGISVSETVIDVRYEGGLEEEEKRLDGENGDLVEGSKVLGDEKRVEVVEPRPEAHVAGVGVVKGSDKLEAEKVCRICHLESDLGLDVLILLGCNCKGELGVAHRHCAEAWFKLKGDRFCEICGEMALNVTGVGDHRFVEEWNETRIVVDGVTRANVTSERGCWRNQRFCNLLMACLVIAFILPWFFRVNMF